MSLYNNFNNIYNNKRMNRSLNKIKQNPLVLLGSLMVLVIAIYFLIKHFDIKLSLRDFYDWIMGVEEAIKYNIEQEEEIKGVDDKQVFNISQNRFTFDDAKLLCKSFGSELATLEQVIDAYKHGANWCNMGWTQDQLALYPIQQGYWEKLQHNNMNTDKCGFPGVNGGHYKNPNLKFGVNCYGKKPAPKNNERINLKYINNYSDDDKKLFKFKKNINKFTVMPFNNDKWSEYQ